MCEPHLCLQPSLALLHHLWGREGQGRGTSFGSLLCIILEHFLIVLASKLVYTQISYPLGIVVFDCVLFLLNILAVLVSVFYVKKIELYAGLPSEVPSGLPSFGSEVRFHFCEICILGWDGMGFTVGLVSPPL